MEGLTEAETRTLTHINVGASVLSFIGSAFIVLCYVCFKELRKFSFQLVFYLALSVRFEHGLLRLVFETKGMHNLLPASIF